MQTSSYLDLFYDDARKTIIEVKKLLIHIEKDQSNISLYQSLFIKLHNLKGHAKGMGFRAIQSMSHALQEVFSEMIQGRVMFSTKGVAKKITNGIYTLEKLIEAIKTGEKIKYLVNKTHLGEILSQAKALQSENTVTEN